MHVQISDLTSLAAYVYSTLFFMTNHKCFQGFLLPFDLYKQPLIEESSVFADTQVSKPHTRFNSFHTKTKFKITKLLLIIGAESNNHNKNIMFQNEIVYFQNLLLYKLNTACHEHKILPFRSNSRILPGLTVLACMCFFAGSPVFSRLPEDE